MSAEPVSQTEQIAIDHQQRSVSLGGRPIALGGRAFDLLAVLAQRPGRVFAPAELIAAVWPGRVVEDHNLRMQITELRRRLGAGLVVNVAGRGYALTPPVAVPSPARHTDRLPRGQGQLYGREADLAALCGLLGTHRLLTVQGAGGVGKTRLALAAMAARRDAHVDGVGWVDLATLADPGQLCTAIASALELQTGPLEGDEAAQRLGQALAGRDALLLLDSAEHLVDHLVPVLQSVLRTAPAVRLLVTSQRLLGLPGEQAYRLEGLTLPAPGAAQPQLRTSPALQLLLHRAQAADAGFGIVDADWPLAAELCRQLDGIPLAIEMAAARLPALGLPGLMARLGERLRLLGSAQAAALQPRQRTLHATLDWSHQLLSADEQAVLRRLSVFAAPFRLNAAQQVGAQDTQRTQDAVDAAGGLDATGAMLAVIGLADKSLLQVQHGNTTRYRLLETTRLYAAQQLARYGECAAAQDRHAMAMAALADEASASFWHSADSDWLAAWQPEHNDWLQAFDHAAAQGGAEGAAAAAAISEALHHVAALNGNFSALRRRLPAVVALAQAAAPVARARLLSRVGVGAVPGVSRLAAAQQRVAAWRPLATPAELCRALSHLAIMCEWDGDAAGADAVLAEARSLDNPAWPPRQRAMGAAFAWPRVAARRHDAAGVREGSQALLKFSQAAGAWRLAAQARFDLGVAAQLAGQPQQAVPHMDAAVAEFRALGLDMDVGVSLGLQCSALLAAGDTERARDTAEQALLLSATDGDALRFVIDALAVLACRLQRLADAARMLGAGQALRQRLKLPRNRIDQGLADEAQAVLFIGLPADEQAEHLAQGRQLDAGGTRAAALAWLHAAR